MLQKDFASALRSALVDKGFERNGACFYLRSDELIWVVEPERVFKGARWALRLGCLVRNIDPELTTPRENQCHVTSDYEFIGEAVPPAARAGRVSDHASYFALAFDLDHDMISDSERLVAIDFAVSDLREVLGSLMSVDSLLHAVTDGVFVSGFIDRRVRALAQGDK